METRIYNPKKLINGGVVGLTGDYVALPDRGFKDCKIEVRYKGQVMFIESWGLAETYRCFGDQFGPGLYTLAYFKWNPTKKLKAAGRICAFCPEPVKHRWHKCLVCQSMLCREHREIWSQQEVYCFQHGRIQQQNTI